MESGRDHYQINSHTVALNFNHCTCYDAKRHVCKHKIAAAIVDQHGRLSISLAMIMAIGGGQLVRCYKGGLGVYLRLEGNTLVSKPLAVEWAKDRSGVERLYPAVIRADRVGFELIPSQTREVTKRLAPELYSVCYGSSIIKLYNALAKHEERSVKAKQRQQLRVAA